MTIQKEIDILKNGESFSVLYNKIERRKSDSPIVTYNTYKISLLLSDGLAAVVDGKIC